MQLGEQPGHGPEIKRLASKLETLVPHARSMQALRLLLSRRYQILGTQSRFGEEPVRLTTKLAVYRSVL